MKLRQRVVLTLVAITVILAIPAAYGLIQLGTLQKIANELRTRDTAATETVGRLRTSLERLETAQANHVALWNFSPDTAEIWKGTALAAMNETDSHIEELKARSPASPRYRRAVAQAESQWQELRGLVLREQARIEPNDSLQEAFRALRVAPVFARMNSRVAPIIAAIEAESGDRVERAADLAKTARSTVLVALTVALLVTLVIGFLLTRAMVRPIDVLRRGMAHVAEGDFEPNVRVPTDRTDEIGDLSRSFATMTEQLAELDRLKAEFVSVASHEIKTPLSVIRGYVSLLADGIYGDVNDQQKKTLESVSDQVDRLTRLVHRLLDISRFEAGGGRLEVRRINVRDFLDELTGGFHVLAFQNGIDFSVNVAGDTPVNIEGDADRLNEVLGNILSNAFKFTTHGGRITLDARRDGTGIAVEVRDSGVGIPPDKLPKIFEKFYQVDNSAQPRSAGSGLGLAIAREIVEAHGGTITAESQVGQGTKFRVTLPERPPVPQASETHAHPARR